MEKIRNVCLALLLGILMTVSVFADDNEAQKVDFSTDYYMIVESPDGGINIYSTADSEQPKLNNELIPNGTALHIEGEYEDESSRGWGYTEYHGMQGYVPLDDCRPSGKQEAINSDLGLAETADVDYQIEVGPEDQDVFLYQGPDNKYGKVAGTDAVPGGQILHITQEAKMEDGTYWGKTALDDKEGWVRLDGLKNWAEIHPEEAGDMAELQAGADMVQVTPTAAPTVTPTAEPTPTAEATATEAPEETPTEEPEATSEPSPSETEDQAASSEDVETSEIPAVNPFIWILGIAVLIAIILLIYHFIKNKSQK
ncbi:MAG: SH3-like domain-containing protein [Eubacteriales bacterium]|nr:SH3-like domain-containing protein [Eubacteriales bacterium]